MSKTKICPGCNDPVEETVNNHGIELCETCDSIYHNDSGYCSLHCSLGGGCDESC